MVVLVVEIIFEAVLAVVGRAVDDAVDFVFLEKFFVLGHIAPSQVKQPLYYLAHHMSELDAFPLIPHSPAHIVVIESFSPSLFDSFKLLFSSNKQARV